MSEKIDYKQLIDELDSGIILLNSAMEIAYVNEWVRERSVSVFDSLIGLHISTAYPQIEKTELAETCLRIFNNEVTRGSPIAPTDIDVNELHVHDITVHEFNIQWFPCPSIQNATPPGKKNNTLQRVQITPRRQSNGKVFCELILNTINNGIASNAITDESQQLVDIVDYTAEAIIAFTDEGSIIVSNQAAQRMFAYTRDQMLSLNFNDLLNSAKSSLDNGHQVLKTISDYIKETQICQASGDQELPITATCYRSNGQDFPGELKLSRIDSDSSNIAVIRDITTQLLSHQALLESEMRFRTLAKIAPVGIFHTNVEGICIYANLTWFAITRLNKSILGVDTWRKSVYEDDRKKVDKHWAACIEGEQDLSVEFRIQRPDNSLVWVLCQMMIEIDSKNDIVGYVGTLTDINQLRISQKKIERLAFYDPLTELGNRRLFKDRLLRSLVDRMQTMRKVALLTIDLDNFKPINDTLGHDAGDTLLRTMAKRLAGSVRRCDTVARVGGDEFAIILCEIDSPESVTRVAYNIQKTLNAPLEISGKKIKMSASIGIALAPDDGDDQETLSKSADLALYAVKESGRDNFMFFDSTMNEKAKFRIGMESDLRIAIEQQEFIVYYQPQIALKNNNIIGMEALVRWLHPEQGMVAPDAFISIAEGAGLIVALGNIVLEEACQKTAQLIADGIVDSEFRVAINLSAKQLTSPKVLSRIWLAMTTAGLQPLNIELEITENLLFENFSFATKILHCLQGLGFTIAIDDFGTGYSSLSHLVRLPVDNLKIDRSFITRMSEGHQDRVLVTTILTLAHQLGLSVVAEGIEEETAVNELRELDCDYGQGYFYSRPLPIDQFRQYIESRSEVIPFETQSPLEPTSNTIAKTAASNIVNDSQNNSPTQPF